MVRLTEEQKAELIKKEKDRRRIARLRQVRQLSATQAKVIRENVSQKKQEIVEDIRVQLHEEIREKVLDVVDLENLEQPPMNLKDPKQKSTRKSMTPRTKKKNARRREVTENDLKLAQKRNADAMRRVREAKERELSEKEEKLAKRRAAEERANQIMRGADGL